MRGKFSIEALVAVCVLLLDQATKALVIATTAPYQVIEVIPGFFNLVNVRNQGAAFGFLSNANTDWSFWLFAGATAVAIFAILHISRRTSGPVWLWIGFGAIMGGAVGNLIDRVRLRAVVDFLDFYLGQWHWPAFNLADAAICTGAALVLIALWRYPVPKKART